MVCALVSTAAADEDVVRLDREHVVELARQHGPTVQIAESRAREVQALHTGARAPAQTNPEVSLVAGPRFFPTRTGVDVIGSVTVPIEVSGASNARLRLAAERLRVATTDADEVRRIAVGDALALWAETLGAQERVQLEVERAKLDDALLTTARARRAAGTIGDGDVALAQIIRAEGLARLRSAEGALEALRSRLHGRLAISHDTPIIVEGGFEVGDAESLAALLGQLSHRPDRARAEATLDASSADVRLQRRLGVPVPRLALSGGLDSEYIVHGALDLPLPVYQRNQTNRAVAEARQRTAEVELRVGAAQADAEVRAAYASYVGAQRAFEALDTAAPAMTDVEHLATRSYELGQTTLATLVVARREAAIVRAAYLDAKIARLSARLALDVAAGVLR